jgi:hypothetical protein
MKYQFEMTEGEFIAWQKLVKSVVKTIAATTLEHAKMRRSNPLESVKAVVKDAIREQVEAIEDDELGPEDEEVEAEDGDSEGATVTPLRVVTPSPASAITKDEAAERATEERRVKVLHGKDTWVTLIEVWRQNFGVEGEQPDRVANLHAAASPFVAAYLQSREGLTDATREAIYLLDGGDPEAVMLSRYALTNRQLREARLIAENIAQVASFHAPWLAQLLEYAFEYRTIPKED